MLLYKFVLWYVINTSIIIQARQKFSLLTFLKFDAQFNAHSHCQPSIFLCSGLIQSYVHHFSTSASIIVIFMFILFDWDNVIMLMFFIYKGYFFILGDFVHYFTSFLFIYTLLCQYLMNPLNKLQRYYKINIFIPLTCLHLNL
jgi:hypothetical protein